MKMALLLAMTFFVAGQSFASSTYTCTNQNSKEITLKFAINQNNIIQYETLIQGPTSEINGESINESEKIYSIQYDDKYDTNLGYDLIINAKEEVVSIVEWMSGNDSDNYSGYNTDTIVECTKINN